MKYRCTPKDMRDYLAVLLSNPSRNLTFLTPHERSFLIQMLKSHQETGQWDSLFTQDPLLQTLQQLDLEECFSLLVRVQFLSCPLRDLVSVPQINHVHRHLQSPLPEIALAS